MLLEGSLDLSDEVSRTTRDPHDQPPARKREVGAGQLLFLKTFLRNPRSVAAVMPSSRRMGRMMADELTYRDDQTIVEIGPGTGTFTCELARRMAPGARMFAIEREPAFAQHLRRRLPGVDVCLGDAIDLQSHMQRRGLDSADYVVSGIGWPGVPPAPREVTLAAIADCLVPGGKFLTFGYHVSWALPSTWSFWRLLNRTFREVSISPVIWANVPPAFIYRCVK